MGYFCLSPGCLDRVASGFSPPLLSLFSPPFYLLSSSICLRNDSLCPGKEQINRLFPSFKRGGSPALHHMSWVTEVAFPLVMIACEKSAPQSNSRKIGGGGNISALFPSPASSPQIHCPVCLCHLPVYLVLPLLHIWSTWYGLAGVSFRAQPPCKAV